MRYSGILLPISSLPSKYGIGTLGETAYKFIDFLKAAGQTYWNILPIGPTGYGDSPYQCVSAFAGNPFYIDLDILLKKNLFTYEEINNVNFGDDPEYVDYDKLHLHRINLLRLAAKRFDTNSTKYIEFIKKNSYWLLDYSLFMAIKVDNNMVSYHSWADSLRLRQPSAVSKAKQRLKSEYEFWSIIQYIFYEQWFDLKNYANKNGVKIIGDIPIYVSPDSSDLWANSELFQVNKNKQMTCVAGCPPDAFSKTGQLWGNPLYEWENHTKTEYEWWISRLRFSSSIYDVFRIDHFRAFADYYSISSSAKTAEKGVWVKGPGFDFIKKIKKSIPNIKIIAEDLGFLTKDVHALLKKSGFAGMKVLQFAFDSREESDYLPHNYTKNSVVYTGTHDNATTQEWLETANKKDVRFACKYLNVSNKKRFTYSLIRTALSSVCDAAIIPLQDYLCLDKSARMNTPGTIDGNWKWRVKQSQLTEKLATTIRDLTKLYFRCK